MPRLARRVYAPCLDRYEITYTVVVEFVDPIVIDTSSDVDDELHDPELEELEENGGGYLSNSDDDSDSDFLFGGEGDKKIVK